MDVTGDEHLDIPALLYAIIQSWTAAQIVVGLDPVRHSLGAKDSGVVERLMAEHDDIPVGRKRIVLKLAGLLL